MDQVDDVMVTIDHASYFRWVNQLRLPRPGLVTARWLRLGDHDVASMRETLAVEELDRAATLPDPAAAHFVAGRWLARQVLSARAGIPAAEVALAGSVGRPLQSTLGWHVSVSHDDGLVVAAVARRAVGVDVQRVTPVDRPLVDRWLTREEGVEVLGAGSSADAAFTRLWARKEAVAKAIGLGLEMPFDRVDVRGRSTVLGAAGRFRLLDRPTLPTWHAAVAAAGRLWHLDWRRWVRAESTTPG
jgi:phosphopantetheinyl transferase